MPEGIDFEAEGLLEGLDGQSRAARLELLEQLTADGVTLDELRKAVAEDRLALLPLQRLLESDTRYSAREVAELSGLDLDFLQRQLRALGLAVGDPDERAFGEADVETSRTVKQFLDAGIPEEGVLEVSRVMGDAMSRIAAAVGNVVGQAVVRPGDTERDLGLRYTQISRELTPLFHPILEHVFTLHQRANARNVAVSQADLEAGQLQGSQQVCVCFADLVGFTRLGEQVDPVDLGRVANRLADLALEVSPPGVRLVKTIGDAVMLVSRRDPDALLDTALTLVERSDQEGEEFPQLRVGIACGQALGRAGDWYGHPVNLASRITAYARPGSVLVTNEVRERARGDYEFSLAGMRKFKGVSEPVGVVRVRRAGARDEP
ncbi:MAG: adenylate cyclase regulatory domain-containing protein [Thermoleophilaceae bacterium]